MRFPVPQFIDVEDKIFGPLTFKQFIYLAGGGGLAFVVLKLVPSFFLGILLAIPLAGLGLGLAFVKVNSKPLINLLEAAFNYGVNDKLYIWKHEKKTKKKVEKIEVAERKEYLPRISESKLHDIAWGLDVLDKR
jgi:hypothetical protein